ncbi:MAG TPA: SulP family inorganic anion transporter [Blastocatellia bacterium]|nr:SulP family inorganic anion transporter [Blastocatellia bacterium]
MKAPLIDHSIEFLRRGTQQLWTRLENFAQNCRKPEQRARWRGDFFGGTVAALIAAPYGMALAIAIGLEPEAGLYTSIIGGLISGMISDSPVVVSGLSATVVPVLAMLVKSHGVGAALAAGVLSGLIMTLIGLLRLGRFIHYLPQSVVGAFTSGLGVIIVSTQIKAIFGVKTTPTGFDLGVVDEFWAVARIIDQIDLHTIGLASIVIGATFLLPRWRSNAPAPLLGVIVASVVAYLFNWQLPRVGALPDSFPKPSLTTIDLSAFSDLIYPAFTLSGLITINQLLTLVVTDRLKEARGEIKFNRELVAQGVANMACPFFGAPPGVAMLARTVASARAGGISRWSVFSHSLVLVLFLLPLRGLIAQIPLAALGAVTVAVGLQLIGLERFRALKQMHRADAAVFLLTFGLVIFSDLIVGVGIGSLLAMLLFIERAAQSTRVEQIRPPAGEPDGDEANSRAGSDIMQAEMQIYRLTGPLFFASSERVLTRLTREVTAKTLVLDLTEAGPIDPAATDCLRQIARRQRQRGGELHLIGLDQRFFASLAKEGLLSEMRASVRRDRDHRQTSRYYPIHRGKLDVSRHDVPFKIKPVSRSGGE